MNRNTVIAILIIIIVIAVGICYARRSPEAPVSSPPAETRPPAPN